MPPSVEQLWTVFSARLGAFIRSRVENEVVAQDLLQEVFLRIHIRMESLRDTERIESWVYQIARNAIIDHYRARRSLDPLPESLPEADDLFQEPDSAGEIAASMRVMVDALPEPYREALLFDRISRAQPARAGQPPGNFAFRRKIARPARASKDQGRAADLLPF